MAVALQDVVASIAGAFSIGFSKLYAVGDRVQIGDTRGDVIDIGLLRTTLMETGDWVSRDLYNGRLVRIPNSTVLKVSVFNYSQGFRFVWDEIKVVFSVTSDCQLAKEMLLRVAQAAVGEYLAEAQISWKYISENFRIENPPLEPTVSLAVNSGSLEFSLSYVIDYTKRTAMKTQLFTKIVRGSCEQPRAARMGVADNHSHQPADRRRSRSTVRATRQLPAEPRIRSFILFR